MLDLHLKTDPQADEKFDEWRKKNSSGFFIQELEAWATENCSEALRYCSSCDPR
jgi:hypothetical protein